MSNFNYLAELQNLIERQQLLEVHLNEAPTYKAAYLLDANQDFLTFVEVHPNGSSSGVVMCQMADIEAIKVDTIYVGELQKQVNTADLIQTAQKSIDGLSEFSFTGLAAYLEKTKTLVELTNTNEQVVCGRVVDHNDTIIVLDEFYSENDRRYAHSLITLSTIARMAVGVPWINTVARSLVDKQL